jgi:Protein of unknown function (DUF2934)
MLQPGSDGEPLPPNTLIFRIGRDVHANAALLERREVLPGLFELTDEDKNSPGMRLSVWAEELTVADQAWDFMGSKPKNTLVVCLNVDDVRGIAPPEGFSALNVEWEQALRPDGSVNDRPGAEGHSGICNLNQGGGGKRDKAKRLRLRMKLAEAAKLSPVPVPHRFEEEQLRVAAYFIAENGEQPSGDCEAHWVRAIRQLRRARVREQNGSASRKGDAARINN